MYCGGGIFSSSIGVMHKTKKVSNESGSLQLLLWRNIFEKKKSKFFYLKKNIHKKT